VGLTGVEKTLGIPDLFEGGDLSIDVGVLSPLPTNQKLRRQAVDDECPSTVKKKKSAKSPVDEVISFSRNIFETLNIGSALGNKLILFFFH
jgi:hypothetical protein